MINKFAVAKTEKLIDTNLSPENAEKKGYTYIDDVFNPFDAIEEVIEFAAERGYKFGNPDEKTSSKQYYGLYRQIKAK